MMKYLVALSLCLALASAKPAGLVPAPYAYVAAPPVPVAHGAVPVAAVGASTQYHAQDELGQVSYGYSNPDSYKAETRSVDGTVVGRYGYISPEGNRIDLAYTAGAETGFQAAGAHLPQPVAPTHDVAAAAADHEAAKARAAEHVPVAAPVAPYVAHQPAVGYAAPYAAAPYYGFGAPYTTYAAAPVVAAPAVPYAAYAPQHVRPVSRFSYHTTNNGPYGTTYASQVPVY